VHVVFDLDGVVLDTEEVVARCYTSAGATPPRPILAQENSGWLTQQLAQRYEHVEVVQDWARVIRAHKNECYINSLRSGLADWLPGALAAARLDHAGHRVHLLSGAPSGTISVVKELWLKAFPFRPWPFKLVMDGMKTSDKMQLIRRLAGRPRTGRAPGVYVDDQDKFIDLPTGWRFVHYTEEFDNVDRLVREITREEGTYT
jgi:hypothetical protein